MSQDTYLTNIISTLSGPWNRKDSGNPSSDKDNDETSTTVKNENQLKDDQDPNASYSTKIAEMLHQYYKNYYDRTTHKESTAAEKLTPISNLEDNKSNTPNAENNSRGIYNLIYNYYSKLSNSAKNDLRTPPQELLSAIKNSGGIAKLNKVIITKSEKKSENELATILSNALLARKSVILESQGNILGILI